MGHTSPPTHNIATYEDIRTINWTLIITITPRNLYHLISSYDLYASMHLFIFANMYETQWHVTFTVRLIINHFNV